MPVNFILVLLLGGLIDSSFLQLEKSVIRELRFQSAEFTHLRKHEDNEGKYFVMQQTGVGPSLGDCHQGGGKTCADSACDLPERRTAGLANENRLLANHAALKLWSPANEERDGERSLPL
ncbi:hypothetical protein BDR04DRAFT_822776 [Suillus decipiens]|nr:hypothetical protein BDR04DRAFT_822776 [Suillus decipiens]